MEPTILICSVMQEAEPLLSRLEAAEPLDGRTVHAWRGRIAGREVVLGVGGMGKSNAASALTALLERHDASGVIGFGIAGAYLGSRLSVGSIAVAASEHYGDEGVETAGGWISTADIGIPLLPGSEPRFNDFPLEEHLAHRALSALSAAGHQAALGPFVTVSTCSGTSARGEVLRHRYTAICESMEGAAYAHIAALYGVPYLGLRAVSNLVEDRDLSRWDIPAATAAAAEAVRVVVAAGALAPEEER